MTSPRLEDATRMAGDVVFPRRATTREGDTAVMATRMAAGVVARCVAAVVAAIARRVAMPTRCIRRSPLPLTRAPTTSNPNRRLEQLTDRLGTDERTIFSPGLHRRHSDTAPRGGRCGGASPCSRNPSASSPADVRARRPLQPRRRRRRRRRERPTAPSPITTAAFSIIARSRPRGAPRAVVDGPTGIRTVLGPTTRDGR